MSLLFTARRAAFGLGVLMVTAALATPAMAATNPTGPFTPETAVSTIETLADKFTTTTADLPMAAVSGKDRTYLAPNGAYETTSNGKTTTICLAPTAGRARCYDRDGSNWASYLSGVNGRYDQTSLITSIASLDDFLNSMEDYGALVKATKTVDGDTTTVAISAFIAHPSTGKGVEIERHEYVFTPTGVKYTHLTDDTVTVTTTVETIKPTERQAVTAP